MGPKGAITWPFARLGGWIDDKPVSAVGALVWAGALVAILMSVGVGVDPGEPALVYDGVTAAELWRVATAQPAYVVSAVVGAAVFLFYDG
jgi:hypothetical protein